MGRNQDTCYLQGRIRYLVFILWRQLSLDRLVNYNICLLFGAHCTIVCGENNIIHAIFHGKSLHDF